MTTISRSYPTHGIDVRCSAALPGMPLDEGRCQLFAGHDGPHAVMFAQAGERIVRTWRSSNPAAAADAGSNALQRPWMYGYPTPAWFEG
jgi:hypothetical protein